MRRKEQDTYYEHQNPVCCRTAPPGAAGDTCENCRERTHRAGQYQRLFGNLYNDLTAFAVAMATFFFGWAALLYMTANQNENHRVQARSALYVALSGLALAILAQTIAGLINGAAHGQ